MEDDMQSVVIRQSMMESLLVAILWIALLVGAFLLRSSMAGVHPAHTGILLVVPPYQKRA